MDELAELIEEIEAEGNNVVSGRKVLASILNQPSLVSISSANATSTGQSGSGFSTFSVNFPRPALSVASVQLLNANIPQSTQNVPDTACVFWYYRLSQYSGLVPNPNNLFFVRLLPSYYKPESILNSSNYGFNRTFTSYTDIATELALAGSNDLVYYNYSQLVKEKFNYADQYIVKFIPNDISITYNSHFNKFQMTGTNAFTPFASVQWSSNTTYASNDIVYYYTSNSYPDVASYQSLQNANSNNNPFTATTYWKQIYTDSIAPWDDDTPYRAGQITTNSGGSVQYQSLYQNWNFSPSNSYSNFQNYLSSIYYSVGSLVSYLGIQYTSIYPSSNKSPNSSPQYWLPSVYQAGVQYPAEFVAVYSNQMWVSLQPVINRVPSSSVYWSNIGTSLWTTYTTSSSNPNYRYLSAGYNDPNIASNQGPSGVQNSSNYWNSEDRTWSPYSLYEVDESIRYGGSTYRALNQNLNFIPFNTAGATPWLSITSYVVGNVVSFGSNFFYALQNHTNQVPTLFSPYWSQQQWTLTTGSDWNNYTNYNLGTIVKYTFPNTSNFAYYQSLQISNTNINPTSALSGAWAYADAPVISLNAVSSDFDMLEIWSPSSSITNTAYPFPQNIPGQPYAPIVKRTLNSILGFSWNGVMTPSEITTATIQTEVGTSYAIPSQAIDLYNRLRPIPLYDVVNTIAVSSGLLGATNGRSSTTTQIYTADGYANLNFSSVVNIYTDIVAGSTLNTQQNNNLLCCAEINCGNLGVAFCEPTINNELPIHGRDLYSIGISLFDEFGDPYVLTNNAVITLNFRFTYKDRIEIKNPIGM